MHSLPVDSQFVAWFSSGRELPGDAGWAIIQAPPDFRPTPSYTLAHTTNDKFVAGLVREFRCGDSQQAWREFLDAYAQAIAQAISYCEREEEDRADAFVFACEQLHRDNCRRLRKFDPEGPASFTTWIRAVVCNLCRDWRRKQFGRLRESTPSAESRHVGEEPRLLRLAMHNCLSLDDEANPVELSDPRPSPEAMAATRERASSLEEAISLLSAEQQLALSLRLEEDLTLQEIASIMRLKNPQAVDRIIRDAIQTLRSAVTPAPQFHGKSEIRFRVSR